MRDDFDAAIPDHAVRDVLHHVNNMAAKILTKAELALRTDDFVERGEALARIATYAETLGQYTNSMRADLLGRPMLRD